MNTFHKWQQTIAKEVAELNSEELLDRLYYTALRINMSRDLTETEHLKWEELFIKSKLYPLLRKNKEIQDTAYQEGHDRGYKKGYDAGEADSRDVNEMQP